MYSVYFIVYIRTVEDPNKGAVIKMRAEESIN